MKVRAGVIVALCCLGLVGVASAAGIQLDLSNGVNFDAYISQAERDEANSYNPCEDWGLTRRTVPVVFEQNALWSSKTYAFQDQVTGVGLPSDGVINAGDWTYQLNMNLDAAPAEGWANPEYPAGTDPRGLLPTAKNIVRAYATHSSTPDPETATVSFSLVDVQKGAYDKINMLLLGSGADEFTIYAIYSDGEEAVWTGEAPNGDGTLDPSGTPSHADLESAYTVSQLWSISGDYSAVRTDEANIWQFKDGLELDETRTLEGLKVHLTPKTWNSRDVSILAVTATPVPEPATLGLLALGAAALIRRRRK